MLRPNIADVLYTLEVNSFKDGLLRGNDHAGAQLCVCLCVTCGRGAFHLATLCVAEGNASLPGALSTAPTSH